MSPPEMRGGVSSGIRSALQTHTRDIHDAMHRAAPFAAIADGTIRPRDYGALLQFLVGYHTAMQPACIKAAAALEMPDLAASHAARIAALQADIRDLGGAPDTASGAAADSAAFCTGCLYTVQGSTLGGKVIHRQLDRLLPDGKGRSFFKGAPQDVLLWRSFCERLEAYGAQQPLDEIEAGAAHAFAVFAQKLDAMTPKAVIAG